MRAYINAGTVWIEQDGLSHNTRITFHTARPIANTLRAALRAPRPTTKTITTGPTTITIETTPHNHWPTLTVNDWEYYEPTADEFAQLLETLDRYTRQPFPAAA